jgi:hypothetical protein
MDSLAAAESIDQTVSNAPSNAAPANASARVSKVDFRRLVEIVHQLSDAARIRLAYAAEHFSEERLQ